MLQACNFRVMALGGYYESFCRFEGGICMHILLSRAFAFRGVGFKRFPGYGVQGAGLTGNLFKGL